MKTEESQNQKSSKEVAKINAKREFVETVLDNDGKAHVVQWLEGKTAEQHNDQPVTISGTISAPSRFLEKRSGEFYHNTAHCLASRTEGTLKLIVNEHTVSEKYTINGKIEKGKKFSQLGINKLDDGKTPLEMVSMLKMRRSLFKNRSDYNGLLAILSNVKANVDKQMEQFADDRANQNYNFKQVVTSNIPQEFTLVLPIIEGEDPVEIPIRIVLEALNSSQIICFLESIEAADLIEEAFAKMIDAEVEKIKDIVTVIFH